MYHYDLSQLVEFWLIGEEWTRLEKKSIQCHYTNIHHTALASISDIRHEKSESGYELWRGIMRMYDLVCVWWGTLLLQNGKGWGATQWNLYSILCFSRDSFQKAALIVHELHLKFAFVPSHIMLVGGRWMMYCLFHTELEQVQVAEEIKNAEISCHLWFTAFCLNIGPLNWLAGTKLIIKGYCFDPIKDW